MGTGRNQIGTGTVRNRNWSEPESAELKAGFHCTARGTGRFQFLLMRGNGTGGNRELDDICVYISKDSGAAAKVRPAIGPRVTTGSEDGHAAETNFLELDIGYAQSVTHSFKGSKRILRGYIHQAFTRAFHQALTRAPY